MLLRRGGPLLCLAVGVALACSSCGLSSKIDSYAPDPYPKDAGALHDGARLSSSALIANWIGNQPQVDADCIDCAETKCADENFACASDLDCSQYTECVGRRPNPAGLTACREQFAPWVNEGNVRERDLGGPYGQCVFRYKCSLECTDDAELWCTGSYALPLTSNPTLPLHLYLIDAFDQQPLRGATVKVCSEQSAQCNVPDSVATTDANGRIDLALPTSFSRAFTGYLEVTGAGCFPTLLRFGWNLGQATTQVVSVIAEVSFKQAIESVLALELDDTRGMLQLRMLGCQGAGVKGVHFDMMPADPRAKTWYIDNGIPKLGATETTPVGSGGIIDVEEGSVTVTASTANNEVVATASAPVRAQFMTVVLFAPQQAR